jgi:hypothetical protein
MVDRQNDDEVPTGRARSLANLTGGSRKGKPNKATADIKALAREYAPVAMKELARLAAEAESEAARVAAIKELFDRGFGKATQPISGDADMPPINWGVAPDDVVAWIAAQTLADDAETAH